ncbi:MAG TPA: glycosyl hydrolase 108 family protein, partial [Hyphomicrobiaceae bacterium]
AQVAKVYRKHYWDKVKGDDLPSGIDYAVFDFAVNSGPTRAAKFLQEVLRVAVDGKIGPQTLAAARRANAADVIQALCDKRMAFLRGLKNWPTFHKGWTSRVAAVRAVALEMAPAKPAQAQKPAPSVPEPQTPETRSTEPGDAKAGALVAVLVALAATAAMVWEWLASLPCDLLGILCN